MASIWPQSCYSNKLKPDYASLNLITGIGKWQFVFLYLFVSFSNPCSVIFQLSAKAFPPDRVLVKCIAFFVFLKCLWEITFEVIQMTRIFIALAFWWTLCNNAAIVGEAGGIVSSWQINAVIDTNHVTHGKHHCVDFARLATRALELAQGARAEAHA